MRSLALLSVAHAINHAQAVVLPLIFLKIILRLRRRRGDDRLPRRGLGRRLGVRPAQLRRPDPDRRAAPSAGRRRTPVRWRVRAPGVRDELRHVRDPEHRVAHRRVAAASGRQRPAVRAVPAGAARLRDQRPHRRRQRRDGRRGGHRRAAHRRGRLARRVDLLRAAGHRRRDRASCCSSARPARTVPPRRPAGPSGRRSGGSPATGTCAGCT